MDIRRLKSFITIVDMGSITRAADVLHIAQPALSQQLASIESHFRQKLLIRSQQGVAPTEAGKVVYRHAQLILRQMDRAQAEAADASQLVTGRVTVGLAPFSSAVTLAVPLFAAARRRYPSLLLHLVESVGQPYSQLVMNGRVDVALIHGAGPIKGVRLEPVLQEEFLLVGRRDLDPGAGDEPIAVARLGGLPFLLPPAYNFVRRAVDLAFTRSRTEISVVGELEAVRTLSRAVGEGFGLTIAPRAIADRIASEEKDIVVRRIVSPVIGETLSLCVSEQAPLSEPAEAVRDLLVELAAGLKG